MVKSQDPVKEEAIEGLGAVEEEEEEEDDGVTRCVCGEADPPDDSGFYIQCEHCSTWQHGFCVGITEGEDSAPDKYWCEQCKPELHSLYTSDLGEHRSVYKPVQQRKRQNRRSRREEESQTDGTEGEEVAVAPVTVANPSEEFRPRKRHQRRKISPGTKLDPEEEKRTLDRRRATSSAREEKQYQIMLEKALKESRRTSHPDDEGGSSANAEEMGPEEQAIRQLKSASASVTPATSSEEDSKRKPRRGAPRKPRSRGSSHLASNEGSSGSSEISITKPVKPRIPTLRTTLNEMRRRVGAILEFISRTQLELSQDQMEKNQLTEFVENQAFIEKVETIFDNYDNSLKIMDDLTRTLLLWEKKYACEQSS